VVTRFQQQGAVQYLRQGYAISQRRAARVLDRPRSSVRYRSRVRGDEELLLRAIRRLARRHLRYGYKRIHALLRREGWQVNIKRVRRLWIAMGLRRPLRRKKPRKPGGLGGSSQNSCVQKPARFKNDVWTCDVIHDRTCLGTALKCLSLVDEYTRECLALALAHTATGTWVRRVLGRVVARRGAPQRLRSDNGSEFIGKVLQGWLPRAGTEPIPVAPASPWENGFIESFHSRLRDEFLDREEFESVADAQSQANAWRHEYNTVRPHSSLGYQTPAEFSAHCDEAHGKKNPTRKQEEESNQALRN
jgi:transposase InsO family protein